MDRRMFTFLLRISVIIVNILLPDSDAPLFHCYLEIVKVSGFYILFLLVFISELKVFESLVR